MTETFSIETLRRAKKLVDDIGHAPFLASCSEFPADHAVRFTYEGREYVGAHPDFWAKVPVSTAPASPFQFGLTPIEDLDSGTAHSLRMKADFFTAMAHVVHGAK